MQVSESREGVSHPLTTVSMQSHPLFPAIAAVVRNLEEENCCVEAYFQVCFMFKCDHDSMSVCRFVVRVW